MADHTSKLGTVILAAGEGTRMRSALPKVLHPLCGRPLLGHVLAIADALAPAHIVIVLAPATTETVRATMGDSYTYAVQAERLGTGHAVLQARAALQGRAAHVLVLYGDTPLLQRETVRALVAAQQRSGALVSFLSFQADPPAGYGRVLRDAGGQVADIIEERNATPEQRAITEVNSGVMCFDAAWLWEQIDRIPRNPVNGEYYLTDLVHMAVAARGPGAAVALQAADAQEAWGINDREQLAQAEAVLRARITTALLRSGVTIIDPATTYVDVDVVVGSDTTLLPGTMLRGATRIGVACEIGPYAHINNARIGDQARVQFAVVEHCTVEAGTVVGPFVHLYGAAGESGLFQRPTSSDTIGTNQIETTKG